MKTALGIRIMEPTTIIDILKLQMHIWNKEKRGNTAQIIKAQEELQQIDTGKNLKLKEDKKIGMGQPHDRWGEWLTMETKTAF